MININSLDQCCGCSACAEKCPKHCIELKPDAQGFLYPSVDSSTCIECGLCEKVCPILNERIPTQPTHVYYAHNKNKKIREESSSGGAFSAIAENIIKDGGIVFGAKFNKDWLVVHSFAESMEELDALRGSKYVQSVIGTSYKDAEYFLQSGRKVLFTGTPCQIAGLKSFLRKDYENLICIDVACHGVPSPLVWNMYLTNIKEKYNIDNERISYISFRDKRAGWRKYGFSVWELNKDHNKLRKPKRVVYEILQQNPYSRGFLQHLYLRPSCYNCHFRCFRSGSDMTMADFWGVERAFPEHSDDRGASLLIEKTDKFSKTLTGNLLVKELSKKQIEISYSSNGALFNNPVPNNRESSFWEKILNENEEIDEQIKHFTMFSTKDKMKSAFIVWLLDFGLYELTNRFVKMIKKLRR